MGEMARPMKIPEIAEGVILAYKGDGEPFISTFLLNKGMKSNGNFLLPCFDTDEIDMPKARKFKDLPGDYNAD